MQQFESLLQVVGMDKKSARIYVTLLKLGETNLEQLSKHSGIPRTSLYKIINGLIQQNIVARFPKRKRYMLVAQPASKVLTELEGNVAKLRALAPQFETSSAQHYSLPKIFSFEGEEGIQAILQEILTEKRNFDAITSVDGMMTLAKDRFEAFIQQRIEQHLRVRLITHRTPEAIKMKEGDGKMLRETRFVPSKYAFTTANYIFGDNTAIISLGQERIFGIIIKDPVIAATQRMYFNLLWDMVSTR